MKKLMIAAAIVCAAVAAQAASCSWYNAGTQITGNFDTGTGDYATGFSFYLINADTYTQSAITTGISGSKDAAAVASFMNGKYVDTAVGGTDGTVDKAFDIGEATSYNAFLVLFDAATIADADYFFVSKTYAATINTVGGKFDWDGDKYIDAREYTTSNWTAMPTDPGPGPEPIPEPTSAMLMLLGMAGLALRRRRA